MTTSSSEDFCLRNISELTGSTQELRHIDRSSESLKVQKRLIDKEDQIKDAVKELEQHNELACDLEGINIGRSGKISLLQIGCNNGVCCQIGGCNGDVYIFDILKLGKITFDLGLKGILESSCIVKIMFDCRNDTDSLLNEYNVSLSNIYDTQLMEFIVRPHRPHGSKRVVSDRPTKLWHWRKPVITGMARVVEHYIDFSVLTRRGISNFKATKQATFSLMQQDKTIWRYRPVTNGLLTYAALDVVLTWEIFESLKKVMTFSVIAKKRLKIASERYAGVRRDVDGGEVVEKKFLASPLLLSYVIPKLGRAGVEPFPEVEWELKKCNGCKRLMSEVQIMGQLCNDCKEIERVYNAKTRYSIH